MDWTHFSALKKCARLVACLLIIFSLSSCGEQKAQIPPKLGMTFDEAEALCGPGELDSVKADSKIVSYRHTSPFARAGFFHNIVGNVWYSLSAKEIADKQLQYYLQINAQGHQWTMLDATTEGTWLFAHWIRDDGATADCGGTNGPFLAVVDPKGSVCGVPDAAPAPAPSTQNGSTFGLRQNVVAYVAKFGKPFDRHSDFMAPASATLLFNHKGAGNELMISVSFWHGVAHLALVSRRDKGELTVEDIRYALKLFSDGEQWDHENPETSSVMQQWHRSGKIGAFVSEFAPNYKVLSIRTDEFWGEYERLKSSK